MRSSNGPDSRLIAPCSVLQEILAVEACMAENKRSWALCKAEVASLMRCNQAQTLNPRQKDV
jgi:hypothetical protein